MSKPRSQRLGSLSVDTGDVICLSSDAFARIVQELGGDLNDYQEFLKRFDAVPCQFHADGGYTVHQLIMVDRKGDTLDVVVIGSPDGSRRFSRFLQDDEPTFDQFCRRHPRHSEVGTGPRMNMKVFRQIAADYRRLLLSREDRPSRASGRGKKSKGRGRKNAR